MFYFGIDYYPEQWPQERWARDAQLMREAAVNVVRLAEFAWSRLEPSEGKFQFDWLDKIIGLLANNGIQVVLGTPTASPPPWVMQKYPDAYIQWHDGRTASYGGRREYCPNHHGYRELSQRITKAMAEHFGANPNVIGWQTDNEFGERCYCSICQTAFQDWLKSRYETLAAVNERWGTVFWSQEYNEWAQIPSPKKTGHIHNPSLELDYFRFMSESYNSLQIEQIAILREHCPQHFITHNMMGFGYTNLDYFAIAEPLDIVSWDTYPRGFWLEEQAVDTAAIALGHDTMRGLKQKNFWVMEGQSGSSGWHLIGSAPRPGEMRLWAYQAIAHGADGILFFRWRSARHGAEQFWQGILDHDGQPRRRYAEFHQLGHELKALGDRLHGSQPQAQVAMLLSYDSRFAFQIQPNNEGFSYPEHFLNYYRAFHERNIAVSIVSPDDDYAAYRLLIVPALYLLSPELAQKLTDFVAHGGTLLLTARSGVKEENNAVINAALPGLLRELCGIEVAEYDSLRKGELVEVEFADSKVRLQSSLWVDVLELHGAEAIAHYKSNHYTHKAAISRHQFGKGKTIYVGTFGGQVFADGLVTWLLAEEDAFTAYPSLPSIEITERWKLGQCFVFILNHAASSAIIPLNAVYEDLFSGEICQSELAIDAFGIRILSLK
jgi:beta-galactosidase